MTYKYLLQLELAEKSDNSNDSNANSQAGSSTSSSTSSTTSSKTSTKIELSLSGDGTTSKVETKIGSTTYYVIPDCINYSKKMYQPGYIKASILISKKNSSDAWPSMKDVMSTFNNAVVQFSIQDKGVAKDYVVFSTEPFFNQQSLYVTLHIYSPDYWMTLSKYSQTFTAKKLCSEILEPCAKKFGMEIKKNLEYDNLKFIYFPKENQSKEEFIFPYLVQYNESFYDFMKRTANRCGEFFYYEDGMLHLGVKETPMLDSNKAQITLKDFKSLTMVNALDDKYINVTDWSNDYTGQHKIEGVEGSENYNLEYAYNEFLAAIKKDQASSMDLEYGSKQKMIVRWIGKILGMSNFYEIVSVAGDEGLLALQSKALVDGKNEKYNDKFFFNANHADEQWKNGRKLTKSDEKGLKDKDELTEFSTYTENGNKKNVLDEKNLFKTFFSLIKSKEVKAASKMLKANLGSNLQDFRLGSKFSYDNDTYITTAVSGYFNSSLDARGGQIWDQGQSIEALPTDTYPYPAPLPELVRISKPQVATVCQNEDPLHMGRIRVKYPWQKNNEASPWLRTVTPMAFAGGGLCMLPQVGEEVMIDYEGGNVERPFVSGGLFNGQSTSHPLLNTYNVIMSSPNGHYIRMKTPGNGERFIENFLPAMKLVKGFTPTTPWGAFEDADKSLGGGIEIGDKYGIVGMSLSTDSRSIDITSPIGTVNISAFNGITISAPNGKVSIKGKDIEIAAGNKLTLTSGGSIKNDLEYADKGMVSQVFNQVGDQTKKILNKQLNLNILRDIFETFLRPIDGTLKIKSYRYLKLEAGRGKTTYHFGHFSKLADDAEMSKDTAKNKKKLMVVDTAQVMVQRLEEATDKYVEKRNAIVWSKKYYQSLLEYNNYADNMQDDGKSDNIIKNAFAENAKVNEKCSADKLFKENIVRKDEITNAAQDLFIKTQEYALFVKSLHEGKAIKLEAPAANKKVDVFFFTAANTAIDNATFKNDLKALLPDDKDAPAKFDNLFDKNEAKFSNTYCTLRRELLYLIIKNIPDLIDYKKEGILANLEVVLPLPNAWKDNNSWKTFVSSIIWKEDKSLLKTIVGHAKDVTGYSEFEKGTKEEKAVWGTEQNGQILMSDDETHTSYITRGSLVSKPNEEPSTIKDYLSKF